MQKHILYTSASIVLTGLALYYGKNIPVIGDVLKKATEGYGQ